MRFGERLRELRKQQGINQRDLADMVEVDFTYISKIETGDSPPPSKITIHRIAQALHANESELVVLAGKSLEMYKDLLQQANKILSRFLNEVYDPLFPVEKYEVKKWLKDAEPYIQSETEETWR
jgi:transcriptional regulator with XRE-family HTH domain